MISTSRTISIALLQALAAGMLLSYSAIANQSVPPDQTLGAEAKPRARDLGIQPGVLPPGPLNAITDVQGVRVGQVTLREGTAVNTGVTAILPHGAAAGRGQRH
jgi:D-aminopeptidase